MITSSCLYACVFVSRVVTRRSARSVAVPSTVARHAHHDELGRRHRRQTDFAHDLPRLSHLRRVGLGVALDEEGLLRRQSFQGAPLEQLVAVAPFSRSRTRSHSAASFDSNTRSLMSVLDPAHQGQEHPAHVDVSPLGGARSTCALPTPGCRAGESSGDSSRRPRSAALLLVRHVVCSRRRHRRSRSPAPCESPPARRTGRTPRRRDRTVAPTRSPGSSQRFHAHPREIQRTIRQCLRRQRPRVASARSPSRSPRPTVATRRGAHRGSRSARPCRRSTRARRCCSSNTVLGLVPDLLDHDVRHAHEIDVVDVVQHATHIPRGLVPYTPFEQRPTQ